MRSEYGIGYSGLSKSIYLAKMKTLGGGVKKCVGDDKKNITSEVLPCVAQLVLDEGGRISWDIGSETLVLEARKEQQK